MTGTMFRKPFPTLKEFLGDGSRADGFEEWAAETIAYEAAAANDAQASFIRIIKIMTVAAIEAARIESETHGRSNSSILSMMSRASGAVVAAAVLCAMTKDTNRPELLKELTAEFREGAGVMIADAKVEDGQS